MENFDFFITKKIKRKEKKKKKSKSSSSQIKMPNFDLEEKQTALLPQFKLKSFSHFLLFLNIYLSYILYWQNERVKIDTELCGFIGERFFLHSSQFWGKFPFMFNLKIYRNISLIQKQSSKHFFFSLFTEKSKKKQ